MIVESQEGLSHETYDQMFICLAEQKLACLEFLLFPLGIAMEPNHDNHEEICKVSPEIIYL